jgi:hypothetical protein
LKLCLHQPGWTVDTENADRVPAPLGSPGLPSVRRTPARPVLGLGRLAGFRSRAAVVASAGFARRRPARR